METRGALPSDSLAQWNGMSDGEELNDIVGSNFRP